jgi:hypothetical protein
MLQWIFGSKNAGSFLPVWRPVGFSSSTVLYDTALTGQCRLLEGWQQSITELTAVPYRTDSSPLQNWQQSLTELTAVPYRTDSSPLQNWQESLTELTAVPSCYRIYISVPSVNIPLSSPLCYITSNWWRCRCHIPTKINLRLYTKAMQLLRQPFTARASGRPPVTSCRNRGAATAVPTVCSEQASILHNISAFICYVYMFLLSVAVDSLYKRYGTVTVPLFRLAYSYTVSTVYKYRLYQSNCKYLCALNINKLSLNINTKHCCHN